MGNLTSQLLVNIYYMNEFDQYIKHKLSAGGGSAFGGKVKFYIRYADDFVILDQSRLELTRLLSPERSDGGQVNHRATIQGFLKDKLRLDLHPNKIILKTYGSGVDFLGWVNFANHRVLRTATKRRMMRRLGQNYNNETLQSYLGLLRHGNTHKLGLNLT